MSQNPPLVVGITGASGAIYGIELLKALRDLGRPAHLILSPAGRRTIELETDYSPAQVEALALMSHDSANPAAPLASGSFPVAGMAVCPCTIKTLSAIANSFNENLLVRTADVQLKERRPLVLVVRETPLHRGHLELMSRAASQGAIILPPMPAFYHRPATIAEIVAQTVGKVLDQFQVPHELFRRWGGPEHRA